jgi:type II secretory pathway pseudopilin PulG
MRRRGLSMVELLVVIGILVTVLVLVLPAVQKLRESALKIESSNNLRQINLAIHQFAGDRNGKLPALNFGNEDPRESVFFVILPYLEHGSYYLDVKAGRLPHTSSVQIKPFISPADPTMADRFSYGTTSYALNALAFQQRMNLPRSFRDGTSNTLSLGERYAFIRKPTEIFQNSWFDQEDFPTVVKSKGVTVTARRATFADRPLGDVYPVDSGTPGVTTGSTPGLTFQVRPRIEDCDPRLAQTPHSSGMLVGLMDGAVRTVSRHVSPEVFWGAVTPSGGEVANLE